MDKVISYKAQNLTSYSGDNSSRQSVVHQTRSSSIKQKAHEVKIDKFFWTDVDAPHKRTSFLAAAGSILGVIIPSMVFAKMHNPELKLSSIKAFKDLFKGAFGLEYHLKEVLGVGLGGVLGGLLGGLADRKERNKIDKLEEASYQTMNVAFPALLVGGGIKLCESYKALNKPYLKLLTPVIGIFIGANAAVKLSNKMDDKFFDKYVIDEERKFKKKDLIVHVDDMFAALALAKIPLADKLHINKLLPAIFAWSGYHVGEAHN